MNPLGGEPGQNKISFPGARWTIEEQGERGANEGWATAVELKAGV